MCARVVFQRPVRLRDTVFGRKNIRLCTYVIVFGKFLDSRYWYHVVVHILLYYAEVRFAIAYTVPELREFKYKHLRNAAFLCKLSVFHILCPHMQ